jgi:hypothetical protein
MRAAGATRKSYKAGGLLGFVSFSWLLKRCRQVSKSAVQAAGEQRYPSSDGGHRPAMASCKARLNVTEAPLDSGKGLQGRGTKPADCQAV